MTKPCQVFSRRDALVGLSTAMLSLTFSDTAEAMHRHTLAHFSAGKFRRPLPEPLIVMTPSFPMNSARQVREAFGEVAILFGPFLDVAREVGIQRCQLSPAGISRFNADQYARDYYETSTIIPRPREFSFSEFDLFVADARQASTRFQGRSIFNTQLYQQLPSIVRAINAPNLLQVAPLKHVDGCIITGGDIGQQSYRGSPYYNQSYIQRVTQGSVQPIFFALAGMVLLNFLILPAIDALAQGYLEWRSSRELHKSTYLPVFQKIFSDELGRSPSDPEVQRFSQMGPPQAGNQPGRVTDTVGGDTLAFATYRGQPGNYGDSCEQSFRYVGDRRGVELTTPANASASPPINMVRWRTNEGMRGKFSMAIA